MATTGTGQGASGKGAGSTSNVTGTTTGGTGAGTGAGTSGIGTSGLGGTSAGQMGGETRDRRAAGETNTEGSASGITQTIRDTTYRSIDDQKSRASETLGSLAGAVRGMTQPLREGGQPQIADYVNKAADGIERWASQLRQQDLEDAVRAVEQFARRQPAMFLGLAFGAGLVAARFLKSSSSGDGRMGSYGGSFDSGRYDRTTGAGPTSIGSTGLGSTGMGSTGMGSSGIGGSSYGTSGTGTTSGDIPRVSGDIRPSGEVL